jgi:uncharacterized membrane protein (DUF373 family)
VPSTDASARRRLADGADRTIELGEQVVYLAVAVVLLAAATTVLVSAAYDLATTMDDGARSAATAALDGLLLVFIFVELLGAVRATIAERSLVAEPFLIVGIIASIKAIVVSSLDASKASGSAFDELILEIGVLAGVILLLAIAGWLVRRKEREPAETDPP